LFLVILLRHTRNISLLLFPVAASRIWNNLPLHVTSAPHLRTFLATFGLTALLVN